MYYQSCGCQQATDFNFCGVCDTRKMHLDAHSEVKQEELVKSYLMDLITRLYVCSFNSFTVSQLAYERFRLTNCELKSRSDILDASLCVIMEREASDY